MLVGAAVSLAVSLYIPLNFYF